MNWLGAGLIQFIKGNHGFYNWEKPSNLSGTTSRKSLVFSDKPADFPLFIPDYGDVPGYYSPCVHHTVVCHLPHFQHRVGL